MPSVVRADASLDDAGAVTATLKQSLRSVSVSGLEEQENAVNAQSARHPLGVKPLGNVFLSPKNARLHIGSFQTLPDESLSQLLEWLDSYSLRLLGSTCHFLLAFCHSDELWKSIYLDRSSKGYYVFELIREHDSRLDEAGSLREDDLPRWRGSWRNTVLGLDKTSVARVKFDDVFSDVLYRPLLCSKIDLDRFSSNIPARNRIQRFGNLPYEEFAQKWSDTPFILTDCIASWPVCKEWSIEKLAQQYADVKFRAESVDWTFREYSAYMRDCHDESPLYLFDKQFAEKMNLAIGRENGGCYWKPNCFGLDLFELLGDERPAHRWLIVGPERSGSTFHKDPNATSAWNAVVQGSKYWIMFPGDTQVPGVYVSRDSSEVTSPLSIAEWLLEFHEEARLTPGCVEGICKAGEILHVPSGWWHLVVNLEPGVALTQNFVPESHLSAALNFLKNKPDQVTGFSRDIENPYGLFVERLRHCHHELLESALRMTQVQEAQPRAKRKWDEVAGKDSSDTQQSEKQGFSFGFESGEDE